MHKLKRAAAVFLAAGLVSANAFAIPEGAAKTLEAPAASVKASQARHQRPHRHHEPAPCCGYYRCCGYYSLYSYSTPCCGRAPGWSYQSCGSGFFGGIPGW